MNKPWNHAYTNKNKSNRDKSCYTHPKNHHPRYSSTSSDDQTIPVRMDDAPNPSTSIMTKIRNYRKHNRFPKVFKRRRLFLGIASFLTILFCVISINPSLTHAAVAGSSISIKPFHLDTATGAKTWLKDLPSSSSATIIHKITTAPSVPIQTHVKNTVVNVFGFMNMIGILFMKRFFPYFLLFGVLPGILNNNRKNSFFRMNTSMKMQDSLEDLDGTTTTTNQFTMEKPLQGEVFLKKKIYELKNKDGTVSSTYHLTINHGGQLRFVEGQSIGIVIPNESSKEDTNGLEQQEQRFIIASSRYGDDKKGKTLSLCVQQHKTKTYDTKYISQLKSGDVVSLTGPYGDPSMTFPEHDPNANLIMIASSNQKGYIAPFRSYLHRLFIENTRIRYSYKGNTWFFLGASDEDGKEQLSFDSMVYGNEIQAIKNDYPDHFKVFLGENKTNVYDSIETNALDIISRLDNGAHLFISGPIDMTSRVNDILKRYYNTTGKRKLDVDEWMTKLENNNQFHSFTQH